MGQQSERKYYTAYDERYMAVHARGVSWSSDQATPIVWQVLQKYQITPKKHLLEVGCGEGRDARIILESGYRLTATDVSPEAIAYCKERMPRYASSFHVLDCLTEKIDARFDFIYAVAVIHMLVLDVDRDGFYRFIREHLSEDGLALICAMGDGKTEMQSDISQAFEPQERNHETGVMTVAATSCRMVSFDTFEAELLRNGLVIVETGITQSLPDFSSLMYAVVRK